MKLVLATRASPLALWQARAAQALLLAARPGLEVELLTVQSTGDRDERLDAASFGRVGIFTIEIDQAVLSGRAHIGVHSLKDMSTQMPAGLVLGGVLARGPVEDVLVQSGGALLSDLERGARIATGSVRRIAMLKHLRPDVEVVPIRGNIETRLAKLARGDADALILARAGLERLGLGAQISEVFDTQRFLPAVGQGIVGLVCRADDDASVRTLWAISDREAAVEAAAERALLHGLHGGCNAPVGGHARAVEGALVLKGRVLSLDGSEILEAEIAGAADDAEGLGRALAQRLVASGAKRLIDAARAQG